MRAVIAALVDAGSALELRAGFGAGVLTSLARIDGRPVGVLASNPAHLGGAIDADAADKAARFMQLCDAHALPIVSLIDTPGFMVGPEVERRAQVRHVSRMFVVAAQLRVPVMAIVVRKAYGLGAMAMAAGGMHAPVATVAWPSGEFGAMGLEGAVELGYRKELAAAARGCGARRVAGAPGRLAVREGQGDPHGRDAGDRRRHRSGGEPSLACRDAGIRTPARGRRPLHRPVVGASGQ